MDLKSTATRVLEIAVLGHTFRLDGGWGARDLAGTTFRVEGLVYRVGTIIDEEFDPRSARPVGRWACEGALRRRVYREQLEVVSTQRLVLGRIRRDTIVTSGPEGSIDGRGVERTAMGNSGRMYVQHLLSTNATTLPYGLRAPNLRVELDAASALSAAAA
jgi:hypothetical protein